MKELIGRTIRRVLVESGTQDYLRFETDEGEVLYYADADCCSESWFADVTGVEALIGQRVLDVEEIPEEEVDKDDERNRQEYTVVYGFKILTARGRSTIAFRNSSNGYYGGWIHTVLPLPAGGYEKQRAERHVKYLTETPRAFTEITEDYAA